jgi:uncharacterized membrane protein
MIGATLQSRRWCGTCQTATERAVHSCGTRATAAGGLPWLGNDTVNLAATATGALIGLATALASGWVAV